MPGWEVKLIEAEARRLIALAAEDDDLRAGLRTLAEEILEATGGTSRQDEPVPPMSPSGDVPPAVADEAETPPPDRPDDGATRKQEAEPLHELTLGRRRPTADESRPPERVATSPEAGDDLSTIEAPCRSKAEAARRAATRLRRTREGADVRVEDVPTDPEIAEWADRLTDCFYWMSATEDSQPPAHTLLDDVGGCFEVVAEASSLLADCEGRRGATERALTLLAEAQSMLRQALRHLQAPDDPDQLAAYDWVRETAARHRIFLKRYMRADDLADPSRWADLLARIESLAGAGQRARSPRPRIEASAAPGPTAEVKRAARLLSGRSVVLIGGDRRPEAQDALKGALGLEEVLWIETKEHQPVAAFEAAIARPEVALVLLAIRWSSHSFGEVREYCERYGKPMVRLPGGYNPNQVAAQVLLQCSGKLGEVRPEG